MADLGVGADAGRDHHQVAGDRGAVAEFDPLDRVAAEHAAGDPAEMDGDAHPLHHLLEQARTLGIELGLHEIGPVMDHMDGAAMVEQAARRFEAEQAAADHHRGLGGRSTRDDAVAVVEAAEREHARTKRAVRLVHAFHRRHEGAAAGRDHELVVVRNQAFLGADAFGGAVDVGDAMPRMERHVVLVVPGERVQKNLARIRDPAQHVR